MKDIITIDCKYYLPCGKCDKTNELCSLLQPDVTVTTKPDIPVAITTNTTKQNKFSANTSFYIPADNGGVNPI